jgi:uncharacterized delta-60 repeat protein
VSLRVPRTTWRVRWSPFAVVTAALFIVATAAACGGGDGKHRVRSGGKVVTRFGASPRSASTAFALAIQRDRRIVAVGFSGNGFALARYLPNGRLDRSFGRTGRIVTGFGSGASATAVAIQPDGKIIAGGTETFPGSLPQRSSFALARYTSDGRLDTGFGTGGKVATRLSPHSESFITSLAVQADGPIVAAGPTSAGVAIARYKGDGSIDRSFGKDGKVEIGFGGHLQSQRGASPVGVVAIEHDGKIVASGLGGDGFSVARYMPDGTPDSTFARGATTQAGFGPTFEGSPTGVAVQGDGKVVAVGYNEDDFALARYNSNGTLDRGFAGGGKTVTRIGQDSGDSSAPYAVTIQRDGKIVAAGNLENGFALDFFALARYTVRGKLDQTFGSRGIVNTGFGRKRGGDARAIAVQRDGRIIAAGQSVNESGSAGGPPTFTLIRYLPNGKLDRSFGASS